jgi:hypothetical protein
MLVKKIIKVSLILCCVYLLIGFLWATLSWYSVDKTNAKTACTPENANYQKTKCTKELIQAEDSVCYVYKQLCEDIQVNSPLWMIQTLKRSQFRLSILTWPHVPYIYLGAYFGFYNFD